MPYAEKTEVFRHSGYYIAWCLVGFNTAFCLLNRAEKKLFLSSGNRI